MHSSPSRDTEHQQAMKPFPRSTKCYYDCKNLRAGDFGDTLAVLRTPASESFSSGLSCEPLVKHKVVCGGRNAGAQGCSLWPEIQTADSRRSLSETTTNPQLLFTVQMGT